MPAKLIQQQRMLQDFIMVKPLAALIISELERTTTKLGGRKICPLAVQSELSHLELSKAFVSGQHKEKIRTTRSFEFYKFYSKNFLTFTLVRHPVGCHQDVFADGSPSLENKVCFSCPLLREERLCEGTDRYGRGGAGIDNHCFALLDW